MTSVAKINCIKAVPIGDKQLKKILIFSLFFLTAAFLEPVEMVEEPQPVIKKLLMECNVTEARVFVDNIEMQPKAIHNGYMLELPPGTYQVSAEKNVYQPKTKTVKIDKNIDAYQKFILTQPKIDTSQTVKIRKTETAVITAIFVIAFLIIIVIFFIHFKLYKILGKGGFATMELLEGNNLLKIIKKKDGTVTVMQKLEIALEVARALKAAHRCEIVHGDITPDKYYR